MVVSRIITDDILGGPGLPPSPQSWPLFVTEDCEYFFFPRHILTILPLQIAAALQPGPPITEA